MHATIKRHLKVLQKSILPDFDDLDDPAEAIQQSIGGITWTNENRRVPSNSQPHPVGLERAEAVQALRPDTPTPPIPARNPARGDYIPVIRQYQEADQRKVQERPLSLNTLNTAQVNKFFQETRPGLAGQYRPEDHPILREGGPSRSHFAAINQGVSHLQPSQPPCTMAGARRTVLLDANPEDFQQMTPHQLFLKSQVKRQQDATNAWAHRTNKPAPPYQFEDFIGKGAYGRVFKA